MGFKRWVFKIGFCISLGVFFFFISPALNAYAEDGTEPVSVNNPSAETTGDSVTPDVSSPVPSQEDETSNTSASSEGTLADEEPDLSLDEIFDNPDGTNPIEQPVVDPELPTEMESTASYTGPDLGIGSEKALDPWFFFDGQKYTFRSDCTGISNCVQSSTPLQAVIDYLKSNSINPQGISMGYVYVEAGSIYEDVIFDGFNYEGMPLTFQGGCDYLTGNCNGTTTLYGSLTIQNSTKGILFKDIIFPYDTPITLADGANVAFQGTSGDDVFNITTSGTQTINLNVDGVGGEDIVYLYGHKYDSASFTVGTLAGNDFTGTYSMSDSTTDIINLVLNHIGRLDSHIDTDNFTYRFDRTLASYTLRDHPSQADRMELASDSIGGLRFNNPAVALTVMTIAMNADLTVESFDNPYAGSLSLLGESDFCNIDINSNIILTGGDLTIQGWRVTVASGKILSTRDINGTDYETGDSIGNSGDITILPVDLTLESGSKILAHANAGYIGGVVTLQAENTSGWNLDALDWIREHLFPLIGTAQGVYVNASEISITDAVITGDEVIISAKGGYSMDYALLEELFDVINGSPVGEFIESLTGSQTSDYLEQVSELGLLQKGLIPIPIGINIRIGYAAVELLGNTVVKALNNISLISQAVADSGIVIKSKYFAWALGVGVGTSKVLIKDNTQLVSTDGDILILANGSNNAAIEATSVSFVGDNKIPLSIGIGVSVLNTHAITDPGTYIYAGGSVNVLAYGENIGGSSASMIINEGGESAIALALYVGISDVLAKVNGSITALSQTDIQTVIPIDLGNINRNFTNSIYIPSHGFFTGDVVTYRAQDLSKEIEGLQDGKEYTVIVIDQDNIRLLSSEPINISNAGVSEGALHSLTPFATITFIPEETVDVENNRFHIIGHGFSNGQTVYYSSMQEEMIGGLIDVTAYEVFWIDSDTFSLKLDGVIIDLTSAPATAEQSFSFLDASRKIIFDASDDDVVESVSDILTIPDHGFDTGDMVFYQVADGNTTYTYRKSFGFEASANGIDAVGDTIKLVFGDGLEVGDVVLYRQQDGTIISGLVDGTEYQIISKITCTSEVDGPEQLCAYIQLALKGETQIIDLGSVTPDPINTNGTLYTAVGLLILNEVNNEAPDQPLRGMEDQTFYYVVKIDENSFRLAATLDDAYELEAGIALGVGSLTSGDHYLDTGLTNGIGVHASLVTEEISGACSWIGATKTALDLLTYSVTDKAITAVKNSAVTIWSSISKFFSSASSKSPDEQSREQVKKVSEPSTFNVAGSLAVTVGINSVVAEVGSFAELISNRDIAITANQVDTWQSQLESDATSTDNSGGGTAAVGAGLSVVVLVNNVIAVVGQSAKLDAERDIVVDASITYPFLVYTFVNSLLRATLGEIAALVFDLGSSYDAGIFGNLTNSYVRSTASANKDATIAIAGSINILVMETNVCARIEDNAQINQVTNKDDQNVTVRANADGKFVNVTGNFSLSLQPGLERNKKLESVKKYFQEFPSSVFSPFGASGGKNGIGGSLDIRVMMFDTQAVIGNGVHIHIGDNGKLLVQANTRIINFSLVQAGSKAADGFGIAGSISYVGIFSDTLARIASTAKVVGGAVEVRASDGTLNINLAGSVAVGGNLGVGVSLAVNTLVRNVQAVVGNLAHAAGGPWQVDYNQAGAQQPLTVEVFPRFDGSGFVTTLTNGAVNTCEIQWIETNATQGQFTLRYLDSQTVPLAFNATAGEVEAALNTLPEIIAAGGVIVSGGEGAPWEVTFLTVGKKDWITGEAYADFTGRLETVSTDDGSDAYEMQTIKNDATGNNLVFTYGGNTTAPLAYDIDASGLQMALNAIIPGGVVVNMPAIDTWTITFLTMGNKEEIIATYIADVTGSIFIEGAVDAHELQKLVIDNASQGAFELVYNNERSLPLLWNASATEIEAALNTLSLINEAGGVTVTSVPGGFEILFNDLVNMDTIDFVGLASFQSTPTVETIPGTSLTKEIVRILHNSPSGAFRLKVGSEETWLLPYDATMEQVVAALNGLPGVIVAGGVYVSGISGDTLSPQFDLVNGLLVDADADGFNWAFSLAAAVTRDEKKPSSESKSQTEGSGMPRAHWKETLLVKMGLAGQNFPKSGSSSTANTQQGAKNSFAIAGDISINIGIDQVEAAIRDAGLISAGSISVLADNESGIRTAAGSVAINTNGSAQSLGIAGSVSFNWLEGITRAVVQNVLLDIGQAGVNIGATRHGDIIALAAGGAGAPKEKGIAIAGSVAIGIVRNITEALVDGLIATSQLAGGLNILADEDAGIIAIAGAVAYGGQAGAGAAFAVNLIMNETRAGVQNSIFEHSGLLRAAAFSSSRIISAGGALGASKGKVGVGGTIAVNIILTTLETLLDGVDTDQVIANGAVEARAENTSNIYSAAGAVGYGKNAGIGAAISFNYIAPIIRALVTNSRMNIGDTNPDTIDTSGLTVLARNKTSIDSASAGGAGSNKVAVAGAVSVNLILTDVESGIVGPNTLIKSAGDIGITAEDDSAIHAFSGNVAGAGKVAVGASIGFNWLGSTVSAYITNATAESINGNVLLRAFATGENIAIAAGGQGAGKVAVGGSVVTGYLGNQVKAFIKDLSEVTAQGNVGVCAEDDISSILIAGVVGGAGTVAVGISSTTLVTNNLVEAYISGNSEVKGRGKKSALPVFSGSPTTAGAWQHVNMRGVWLTAVSNHAIRNFAVGGVGAGNVAVAGSGSVSVISDTVRAYVDDTSSVNEDGDDDAEDDPSGAHQSVNVFAAGNTIIWGVAGALAGAGTVGVGAGLDVGVLTKTVEAYIAGTVKAIDDILVQAISHEQVISVSASLGAAGTVGIAGSVGVYSLILNTIARIASTADVYAGGSVLVNAVDKTDVIMVAGSIAGAGTVGVGGSFDVSVTSKDVLAYIEGGAKVDALGHGDGVTAFSGSFTETWTEDPHHFIVSITDNTLLFDHAHGFQTGDQVIYANGTDSEDNSLLTTGGDPLKNGGSYYAIYVSDNQIKLAATREDALAGMAISLTPDLGGIDTHEISKSNVVYIERPAFDPETAIQDDYSIEMGYEHGYITGQELVYSAGGNVPILGLEEGATYYAIVDTGNPTFLKLALDKLDAFDGKAIEISSGSASGKTHSLWDGRIGEFSPDIKTPGPQFGNDLNNDGTEDSDGNQDALTKKRSANPGTIIANGVIVSALNQDLSITVAISGGGAGAVAVNISGLVNVIKVDVEAFIGEGALVNERIFISSPVEPNALQSVYVLAGNDYYHIGIAAVGNGAGTVSVTPDADITVTVNNVRAYIADHAEVYAQQDVIVSAEANGLIVSVSVGITGSGLVSVAGSISVISINNSTVATIGENDEDTVGAVVYAYGNVMVNALDTMEVILVSGSLGLGFGAVGVGASIGVLVENKQTSAFIAPYSIVNGKGNGAALINVYKKDMNEDGTFALDNGISGVVVQAYSKDLMITVAGSGAFGLYTGVAGAVMVDVFLSDTNAWIGAGSQVNQDRSGANAMQDVVVNSMNYSKIFNFAGSVGAGLVGIGGAIQVNIIRNNAKAYIGNGAYVTANRNVVISALNNKDIVVVAAAIGVGGGGFGLTILVNVVGSEFTTRYTVSYDESNLDEDGNETDDQYQETIDEDPLALGEENQENDNLNDTLVMGTNTNSTFSDQLGLYDGSNKSGSDPNSFDNNELSGNANRDVQNELSGLDLNGSLLDAMNASGDESRSGTVAYIGIGAVVTAETGDIHVNAVERVHFVGVAGTVTAGGVAYGAAVSINVVGSNVEAYVLRQAVLNAGNDINITAKLMTDMQGHAIAGNLSASGSTGAQVLVFTDNGSQRASLGEITTTSGDAVIVESAQDILVLASAERKVIADASGVNAALAGSAMGISVAVSSVYGQTVAYIGLVEIGKTTGKSVHGVSVQAVNDILSSEVWTVSLSVGSVALGAAVSVNVTDPTAISFITPGADIETIDHINVMAIGRANAFARIISVNVGGFAGGVNVAVTVMSPIIEAYVESTDAAKTTLKSNYITIMTVYNYDDAGTSKVIQGAKAESYGASGGIGAIQGDIAVARSKAAVRTFIDDGADVTGLYAVLLKSMVYNQAEAYAYAATVGGVAASVNLAIALTDDSTYFMFIDDAKILTHSLTMNNHVTERDYAEIYAGSIGLVSGMVNVAVAHQAPQVKTYVEGSTTHLQSTGDMVIASQFDADAFAKAFGITVAYGVSLGASVGVSISNPIVEAYVSAGRLEASGSIRIEARQNTNDDKTHITTGSGSSTNASGGGLFFGGNGAVSYASITPLVKSYTSADSVLSAGDAIIIQALAYNKSHAEAWGVTVGGLAGIGASVARATSQGSTQAYLGSNLFLKDANGNMIGAAANDVTIQAETVDDAYTYTLTGVGGIIAGGGSSAKSWANSTTQAYIQDNLTVFVLGTVTVRAIGTPKSYALADGVAAGGLAVGVSEAFAESSPVIDAWLGSDVNLFSGAQMIGLPVLTFTDNTNAVYLITSATSTGDLTVHSGDSEDPDDFDTITRTSGSWLTDGFLDGYLVRIKEPVGNITYVTLARIHSISADGKKLILTSQGLLENGTISGASVDMVTDPLHEITRDSGDWRLEGFKANQVISISGTNKNNRSVTITSISSDGKTLYISVADAIFDESNANIATIQAIADSDGNLVVEARQALPEDGDPSAYSEANASGGALIGVNASNSYAYKNNTVSATLGENGNYSLTGDLELRAQSTSSQSAKASGKFGGILAIGHNPAVADSYSNTYATVSDGVMISAESVWVVAWGEDTNFAESISGMGGVVSIQTAAHSETNTISNTEAKLLNNVSMSGITMKLESYHHAIYNSKTNSINASLVGYSGATAANNEESKVLVNFGNANLTFSNFYAIAENNTTKDWLSNDEYNVTSGSGGLIDLPAAKSETTISKDTDILVQDGALLTQTGSQFKPGEFIFSINHTITAYDKTKLDAGGAIAIAKAVSSIVAEHDIAKITIGLGNGVTINAIGDVRMIVLENAKIRTIAHAKTYGVAGVAQGNSLARMTPSHQIIFNDGAILNTKGNVHLYVGEDDDFHSNRYDLMANTELWNWTAVPINVMDGSAELDQVNQVIIHNGAILRMARNAFIRAKSGFVNILGHAKGTDSYSAGAGAMIGDETAFESAKTSKIEEADNGIIIDGEVHTGSQRSQEIVITGTITFYSDGSEPLVVIQVSHSSGSLLIGYVSGWESIANNIQDELDRLENLKAAYNGNTTAVEAYQAQIDAIIQDLIAQGYSVEIQTVTDAQGNTQTVYGIDSSIVAYFITIDETWAQAGEIYVDSDYLIGTGILDAPPDASIIIRNSGPFYIRTQQLTIPSEIGGRIVFNDIPVTKAELALKVPEDQRAFVQFSAFSDPSSSTQLPQILIENIFEPGSDELPTDLLITGDIINIRGEVTITNNYGSVLIALNPDGVSSASVDAGKVTITAGRDFVQGYTDKFFHTGGNPADIWSTVIEGYRTQSASLSSAYYTNTDYKPGTGQIIAGNRVFISARYLNINGLVQSGRPEKSLTLGSQAQTKIANEILYYNQNKNKLNLPTRVSIYSDADFIVYFNLLENRIEISSVRVEGGYIELHGTVINTGGGSIKALSGFGSVSVTNNTGYDIMFNTIDTGRGVDGRIIIYDSNYTTSQMNNGVSTTRTKAIMYLSPAGSDEIHVYTNENENFEFKQLSGEAGTISEQTTAYQPKANQWYSWMTGQRTLTELTQVYGSSSFWGCDGCVKDPDELISSKKTILDKVPLLEEGSDFIQVVSLGANTNLDFRKSTLLLNQKVTVVTWKEAKGWWIFKAVTYYTKYITETGQKIFNQMRVRADFPIDIQFIGRPNGGLISLTSNSNILLNGSLGNSHDLNGTVTISSTKSVQQAGGKIYAKDLAITAGTGIGSLLTPIVTDMRTGGSLSAETTVGNIYIQETLNDLVIDQITTGKGRIVIVVDGSLQGLDSGNLIKANQIEIYSAYGAIGTSAIPIRMQFVPATMLVNNQTVPDPFHDYVAVTAPDDIFLTTINGDMPVRLIQSLGGDVTIVVTDGDLLDRNFTQELDTRTYDELKALWDAMNLTGSAAEAALAEALAAYTSSRESEYEIYWKFRLMQSVPGTYDPNFVVPVSEEEANLYKSQLNLSDSAQAIIDTLSVKRTDEYHALHRIYGMLGDTYISGWTYSASATYEPAFDDTDVDTANNTIRLGLHIFRDKQAVSLICGTGSSISNLVCSDTSSIDQPVYYIKLDAANPGLVKLAASLDDWTANIFVELETAVGSFQLSEIVAMSSGYKWSENQLRYTLNAGWLKETADTQTAIEEPNIIAQGAINISTTSGNIGSNDGIEVIDLSGGLFTLSDDQRVLLASTERRDAVIIDDIHDIIALGVAHNFVAGAVVSLPGIWNLDPLTIPGLGGQSVYYAVLVYKDNVLDLYAFQLARTYDEAVADTPTVVDLTQKQIRINLKSDFNVESKGALTANASGFAYIGSEMDVIANNIQAGDELRVKTGKGIYRNPSAAYAVISGCLTSTVDCSVILEAGGGSIGTSASPVSTNILAPYGSLTARAQQDIYIHQLNGNLLIDVIYAPNLVSLNASAGSLLDAFNDEKLNIKTGELILNALNDVGEADNMLEIDLPFNTPLSISNVQNVYLYEILGNMMVNLIEALHTVSLKAQMSILDYLPVGYTPEQQIAPKIICDTLILESVGAGIGSHANELHVNSHVSGSGTLSALGGSGDVLINEMAGDLYIDSIDMHKGGIAYLFSVGSIFNGHPDGDLTPNVIGDGYVRLYASHGIGTIDHPLRSEIGYLQGYANNGSSYLTNDGLLHVGWDNNPEGFTGNGNIIFKASSPLIVIQNVTASGDLTLVSNDSVDPGDDITILSDRLVTSTNGSVYLYVGDNFYMQPDSWINAFGNVYIYLDYNSADPATNLDPEGSTLTVNNPNFMANALYIYGNTQDDSIILDSALVIAYLEIQMGAGMDVLTLLNDLQASVSRFYLGDGDDLFVLNTIGDHDYDMVVFGGSGNDRFQPMAANTDITMDGNEGNDFFELYFNIPFTLTLIGGSGDDTFDFADGIVLDGTIDGGTGSDKIDLTDYTSTQTATLTAVNTSGFDGTVISSIPYGFMNIDQLFVSTVVLDDTLYGMDAVARWDVNGMTSLYTVGTTTLIFGGFDYLQGGNKTDTFVMHAAERGYLYGNDGDDTFTLLDGASLDGNIYGGNGINLVDYSDYTTPVDVNLTTGFTTNITQPIVSIQNAAGGSADDLIIGNNGPNSLWGNGGSDVIYGLGGDDLLNGGGGDDELYGGMGNDRYMYETAFGKDNVYELSGQGTDVFDFSGFAAGLTITVNTNTIAIGADTITHLDNQVEYVLGSPWDDIFLVNEVRRISLLGGDGGDTFFFFDGINLTGVVDGQAGHDVLNLASMTVSQNVLLTGLGAADGFAGTVASIVGNFTNIDEIMGSLTASDTLTGMNAPALFELDGTDRYIVISHTLDFSHFETLRGGSMADIFQISGVQTYDMLHGGGGNDWFLFLDQAILNGNIDGGTGSDNLDFSIYSTGRIIYLTGYSSATAFTGEELSINGHFANIDHLIGSQWVDELHGVSDSGVFTLAFPYYSYKAGRHLITFEGFEDLIGSAGNDTFIFHDFIIHAGNLDGGPGIDTLDLSRYTSDIVVDLSLNFLSILFSGIYNIENVYGGSGNDTITGDDNSNLLKGGDGDDTLYGLGGNDILYSGSGSNTMYGGDGDDIFHNEAKGCRNTLYGGDGFDTLYQWRRDRHQNPLNDIERILFYPEPKEEGMYYRVIDVISGEQVELTCFGHPNCIGLILRLTNFDQVTFGLAVGNIATLLVLNEEALPAEIPEGMQLLSAIQVDLASQGVQLEESMLIQRISFAVPKDYETSRLAILFWDEEVDAWTMLDSISRKDRNVISGVRMDAIIHRSGIYIMVLRM